MAASLETGDRLERWLATSQHKRKLQGMANTTSSNIGTVEALRKRPAISPNPSSLTLDHLLHYHDRMSLNQLISGSSLNLNINNGELQSNMNAIELDSDAAAATPLPSGWEKCLDLKTGSFYYYNRGTGRSSHCDPRLEKAASDYSLLVNEPAVNYMQQEHRRSPLTYAFARPSSPSNSSSELTCEPSAADAITLKNKSYPHHHHLLHFNRQEDQDQEEATVAVMAAHAEAAPPEDSNLDLNLSLGGPSMSPPTSNPQSQHHVCTADDEKPSQPCLSKNLTMSLMPSLQSISSSSPSSSPLSLSSSPSSVLPSSLPLPSTSSTPSILPSSISSPSRALPSSLPLPLRSLVPLLSTTSSSPASSSPLPSSLSSPLLSSSTSHTAPHLSTDRAMSSPASSVLDVLSHEHHQLYRLPASISSQSSFHGCNIETNNDSSSMVTMACSHCLMFVMLSTSNPKCPRCGTAYSPLHHHEMLQPRLTKTPKLEFLL